MTTATSSSSLDTLSPYRMCVYVTCRACCEGGAHRAVLANTLARLISRSDMSATELVRRLHERLPPAVRARCKLAIDGLREPTESVITDGDAPLHAGHGLLFTARSFVKANSVLGKYLRQVMLAYRMLDFDARGAFKTQLRAYLSPLRNADVSMASDDGDDMVPCDENVAPLTSADVVDDEVEDNPLLIQEEGSLTHSHAIAVIAKQLHLLRVNESAALPFAAVELMCDTIALKLPALTQTHYLRVMNALRMGDEALCENRLHAYFDRLSQPSAALEHELVDDGDNSGARQRFASLLHAKVARVMRSYRTAVTHLHECINKSEEAGDTVCLQFALWEATQLLPLTDDGTQLEHLIETASRADTGVLPDWQTYRVGWQRDLAADVPMRVVHVNIHVERDISADRREYMLAQLARRSSEALARGHFRSSVHYAQQTLHLTCATERYGHALATHPVAVAYANMAHVAAANAHWSRVQRLIQMAQCTRAQCDVIDVCHAVITHQRCLLNGQIDKASRVIKPLRARHTSTWLVLEALCQLCMDDVPSALSTCVTAAKQSRGHSLHTALLVMTSALIQLEQLTAATACAQRVLADQSCTSHMASVARVMYSIQMRQKRRGDARALLDVVSVSIDGAPVYDQAVYHMLRGRVLADQVADYDDAVAHLSTADQLLRRLCADVLVMHNLKLIVGIHNRLGNVDVRNRHAKRWNALNARHEHSRTLPLDL